MANDNSAAGVLFVAPAAIPSSGGSWQFKAGFTAPQAGDVQTDGRPNTAVNVTNFWAKRTGGTGAVVDYKKNGVSQLTGTLSLTTTNWTAGVLIGGPVIAIGDSIEHDIISVAGGPGEILTTTDGNRA